MCQIVASQDVESVIVHLNRMEKGKKNLKVTQLKLIYSKTYNNNFLLLSVR